VFPAGRRSIFKDHKVFDESWLPSSLRVRAREANELISLLLSRIEGGVGLASPILIYGARGAVGIGKTTLAKYVAFKTAEKARERGYNVKAVATNLFNSPSVHQILSMIVKGVGLNIAVHGNPVLDTIKAITDNLARSNSYLIVVLDEFQSMILSPKVQPSDIYTLIRYYEAVPLVDGIPRIGFILVVSDQVSVFHMREKLPQIESQIAHRVRLERYTPQEIYEILLQRAELGLREGTWRPEHLELIAESTGAPRFSGSARLAIKALYNAAILAEQRGLGEITMEDVREALSRVSDIGVSLRELQSMHLHELLLLQALAMAAKEEREWVKAGDLKKLYEEVAGMYGVKPLGYTQFYEHIRHLAQGTPLVDMKMSGKGYKGRTTFYRLSPFIPPTSISELLETIILERVSREQQRGVNPY